MQYSPINSLCSYEGTTNIQSTSSLVSTCSAYSPPIVSTRNTDEIPLTLSLNQDIVTNEDLIHSSTNINTPLNVQLQHENNQRNFWREFQGNVTEDLFKEKILDCIKNNWKFDPSLKQNLDNPILEIRKDIQYKLLLDMLFQLKFTHFINIIVTDMFKFIQTENQINESNCLGELEIIIAKYDLEKEISEKFSFIFNTVYIDYFNRKNQVLSQDALIELVPLLTDELQQAEKENLESKIDSNLFAITLPKLESLFTEEIRIGSKEFNENDEINSIIQCNESTSNESTHNESTHNELSCYESTHDISVLSDSIDMHFHLITNGSNLQLMPDTNEPQISSTETMLQTSDIHPVTNTNIEALQKSNKSSDERIFKSLLASITEENFEKYEQALFKAYKENNPLKDKYLTLTTLALEAVKGCLQIKTRIARLSCLEFAKKRAPQNIAQLKSFFYKNLTDILTNFINYQQLIVELKPQRVRLKSKISTKKMKKTHYELIITIQQLKKRLINRKKKYNGILNKEQITKTKMTQNISWYLSEPRSMEIIQEKFIHLSVDKIKEIIFSSQFPLQPEDDTDTETVAKEIQQRIESAEAIQLEFLLANIFTLPFYYDEQVLFKVYEENHPSKDKYLLLMMLALNAKRSCLQIKGRIAQLEHLTTNQAYYLEQEENYYGRSMNIVKTILCKDLTKLLANSTSYFQLMEELKPLEIQITKKISTCKMKQINTNLMDKIRALKLKMNRTQQYYKTILNEKQITEKQIMQNLQRHLTEKEVIETIHEIFDSLPKSKIKEIITATKITPQTEDNTEVTTDLLHDKNESEEILMLESMLVNIFNNPFYYNEQLLFDAYINNDDSKEDFLALIISAMQARGACLKIKTRIIQLINFEQSKDYRECDISAIKNYLCRDLTELFTNSSDYNRLMDKLSQPRIQAQAPQILTRKQLKILKMLNKSLAEVIRRKRIQLRGIQYYFNSTNRDKPIEESQILQSMLVHLSEQKTINTIKKKFTLLTEDKIKEIIVRSALLIAKNQNNKAIEANSNKLLNQGIQGDNRNSSLAPPAKKMCKRKSKASASLSKALPESAASQNDSQVSTLRFSQSEALAARESTQGAQIHFPPQSIKLAPTLEEMKFTKASQFETISADISFSDLFFKLAEQEGSSEDFAIPTIEPIDYE